MKQQQEAERLAHEAKKKAEEEAAKREKQKKAEMERQKREQERLRKEEEKRHREEERLRKEEEKKRRIREEKERAAEKERKRKEKEEKERIEKENMEKARAEKEEKERVEREKAQEAKAAKEERDRLEREKAKKIKAEKEERDRLRKEADAAAAAAADALARAKAKAKAKVNTVEQISPRHASPSKAAKQAETPVAKPAKTPSPPPGITAPAAPAAPASPEDVSPVKQQALIDALVGSGRPNTSDPNPLVPPPSYPHPVNAAPIRPPPPPFMPSHLDILQGTSSSSSLLNASPIDHHTSPSSLSDNSSPSMLGIFNNRVSFPLEPSASSRRSITPIAPIGQPISGRRVSSVPLGSNPLHDSMSSDPIMAASNAVKRPSVASPFDSTEPKSFFSSFLFGEPRNTMMPMNEYDSRFAPQQPSFDRRFSTESSSQPMQPNWTNGWTATSVLSDNVHGKLFGDALVSNEQSLFVGALANSSFLYSLIAQPWRWTEPK